MIFSIAMAADNSFYVIFVSTNAPTFFEYIISVLAIVNLECKRRSSFIKKTVNITGDPSKKN